MREVLLLFLGAGIVEADVADDEVGQVFMCDGGTSLRLAVLAELGVNVEHARVGA